MTVRAPIVRVSGKLVELPTGDYIGGAPSGSNGTNGTNGTDGVNGGATTISYTFDTTTTDADPGNGKLRLNNATQNTATTIYVDLLDTLGSDWTTVLDTFDDSTNTVKGSIRLVKSGDASKFLTFNVTAVTTATGYRKITVTNTGSSAASPFANSDTVLLCFDRAGDAGSNASSAVVKLAQVVTASSASTITFSSISGSYTNLQIIISGRDTGSVTYSLARMKINGDTTSGNYTSSQYVVGFNSSTAGGQEAASSAGAPFMNMPGVSGNANALGSAVVFIPNYAQTTFHKSVQSQDFSLTGDSAPTRSAVRFFVWKSTSAITDIVLTAGGTAFVDGTTATLYGMT